MIRILNTRPLPQAKPLSRLLARSGFGVDEVPLVELAARDDAAARLERLEASAFQGLFFSSVNGVRFFADALSPRTREAWFSLPVNLVGGKARPEVEKLGAGVRFVPPRASLAGFLEAFPPSPRRERWLHPCSARTALDPGAFLALNVAVENLPVYRPGIPPGARRGLEEVWPQLTAAVFCSGSAAENLFAAAPALAAGLGRPGGPRAFSIGPSTTRALAARGVAGIAQAPSADNAGLVKALERHYLMSP